MQHDQREQGIVQALEVLPAPGVELPQGAVGGDSEQPTTITVAASPFQFPRRKLLVSGLPFGDEVVEDVGDLSRGHAPAIQRSRGRRWRWPSTSPGHGADSSRRDSASRAEGRPPDEEREPEELEGNLARSDGKLRHGDAAR